MANQLPAAYWDSLGENGPFLKELLSNQSQQIQQLHLQNQELQNHLVGIQGNLVNAASTAAVAAAQHIGLSSIPNISSARSVKAADPKKFNGDRAETEEFVRAVKLAIAIQPGSFPDERTKLLYALSFMSGGTAQVWAHNETETIINGTSSITTFEEFTRRVEETFGDPDRSRTARTKLHNFKMMPNMTVDDYTAQFDILAARTGFNEAALEDAYSRGLLTAILERIHAQPSLPRNLKAWKEIASQIDRNHRRFTEIKRAQAPRPTPARIPATPVTVNPAPPMLPDAPTPMEIDTNRRRIETRKCYNCGKYGHISPQCTEPRKQRIRTNLTETDIAEMISKSVAAALDTHKQETPTAVKEDGKDF
jgi:hypothetical protein